MDSSALIEAALEQAVARAEGPRSPSRLAAALRHAVFPGGARVRPRLCVAVAGALGAVEDDLEAAAGAAAAVELLHCASLVHDDLPCFDHADIRRGKPSVHAAFGEPLAVLTGDALIVMSFGAMADACARRPARLAPLLAILQASAGAPSGICAGQAWESEPTVDIGAYHRSKTGALFVAASMCGAVAAGADPEDWRGLGERLGEAYQIADDLRDFLLDAETLGKPAGQDAAHDRPNAARALGPSGARDALEGLIRDAAEAVPDCPGGAALRALVEAQTTRLMPADLLQGIA